LGSPASRLAYATPSNATHTDKFRPIRRLLDPGLALAGIAGTSRQEAFQLLQKASAIFYGLTYLVMFAIPILGQAVPSLSLRLAAASGFAMALLCVVLSIFPIINVPNRQTSPSR
jgi:hypothetical protein